MAKIKKKKGRASTKNRQSLVLRIKAFIDDYVYRIDLDADYQREKVWSRKNQEELLDSILRDIDIPKLYLAEIADNKQFDYECIDGKQRMLTLLSFFKPEANEESPLRVDVFNNKYTYQELKKDHPNIAKTIDKYELNFIVYKQESLDDNFVREIFRRLQLGIRLNSGELLNSQTGTLRDFVFKEIGRDGPFLRNTNLSDKRYSRQFTLAQICINSFSRKATGDFGRARLTDLQYFFEDNAKLNKEDENLDRIRKVLKIMDAEFGTDALNISSRAIAVSAYLFVENLYLRGQRARVAAFAKFYVELLKDIKRNMDLLSNYEKVKNPTVMEEFQKYILQASVEPYSIRRRDEFLERAFAHYLRPSSEGEIIGSK